MQLVATVLDGTVLEGFSPTLPQGSFAAISLSLSLAEKLLQSVFPQTPVSDRILITSTGATCPRQ